MLIGFAIYPVLAVAALVLAIRGDIRRAIMALALIVIVTFFADHLPSMFQHGLEFRSGGITGLHLLSLQIVYPLLAVVALVLARRNARLWLATFFVSLSTLTSILGVLAFAIGVIIYGF